MKKISFFLLILINSLVLICSQDFYQILEVNREVDEQTLKKAFRKLSLKYHPDRNKGKWIKKGDPNAQEMFIRINKAYETLSDPERRKIYDIYGEEGLNQQNQ